MYVLCMRWQFSCRCTQRRRRTWSSLNASRHMRRRCHRHSTSYLFTTYLFTTYLFTTYLFTTVAATGILPPTPYALHPTPYTLRPTPYSLHPTPYTLHPAPYAPYTLHPTPCTLQPAPYTVHPAPCTPNCKLQSPNPALLTLIRVQGLGFCTLYPNP